MPETKESVAEQRQEMRRIGLVLVALLLCGHGPADWIRRDGYKNAIGELCCGEQDCSELLSSDVRLVSGGYLVVSLGEFVPFSDVTPSPNKAYWRCQWGGARKCFFAPVGAS